MNIKRDRKKKPELMICWFGTEPVFLSINWSWPETVKDNTDVNRKDGVRSWQDYEG